MEQNLKKYDIISADCPWRYDDQNANGERGACFKYKTMNIKDIQALPVHQIAKDNSILFLWCTAPLIGEGIETVKRWGFKYKTIAFVWVKQNKDGSVFKGLGHYTRSGAEYVLLGVRGKPLKREDKSVPQVLLRPRTKHSQKPFDIEQRIVSLYPNREYSRVELFARDYSEFPFVPKSTNWDRTGLEYDGVYIEDFLRGETR